MSTMAANPPETGSRAGSIPTGRMDASPEERLAMPDGDHDDLFPSTRPPDAAGTCATNPHAMNEPDPGREVDSPMPPSTAHRRPQHSGSSV